MSGLLIQTAGYYAAMTRNEPSSPEDDSEELQERAADEKGADLEAPHTRGDSKLMTFGRRRGRQEEDRWAPAAPGAGGKDG